MIYLVKNLHAKFLINNDKTLSSFDDSTRHVKTTVFPAVVINATNQTDILRAGQTNKCSVDESPSVFGVHILT